MTEYPSVTQICSLFWANTHYPDGAAERGSYYHDLIHQALKEDNLDLLNMEPLLHPVKDWLKAEMIGVSSLETTYMNGKVGYCGTPDAVLETKSYGLTVVDWKTGVEQKSHIMQIEAYQHLDYQFKDRELTTLRIYLHPTGLIYRTGTTPIYYSAFQAGVKFWWAKEQVRNL